MMRTPHKGSMNGRADRKRIAIWLWLYGLGNAIKNYYFVTIVIIEPISLHDALSTRDRTHKPVSNYGQFK
jgi:hypothetical protein